ncbi:hypothetical protein [Streptosporangium sp. OZ121]|uniref:hypothetical protein n=1 Tax=Streptosporangium sp. OZ121 TaxID=3444183 RepID=UPI003F7AFDDD
MTAPVAGAFVPGDAPGTSAALSPARRPTRDGAYAEAPVRTPWPERAKPPRASPADDMTPAWVRRRGGRRTPAGVTDQELVMVMSSM